MKKREKENASLDTEESPTDELMSELEKEKDKLMELENEHRKILSLSSADGTDEHATKDDILRKENVRITELLSLLAHPKLNIDKIVGSLATNIVEISKKNSKNSGEISQNFGEKGGEVLLTHCYLQVLSSGGGDMDEKATKMRVKMKLSLQR